MLNFLHLFALLSLPSVLLGTAVTVAIQVKANIVCIDAMTISASPGPFVMQPACAGDLYCQAIDQSTTYAVTTNNRGRSIYGALDKALPPDIFLNVHFAPPQGASSWGEVPLSTANNRIVGGISNVAEGSLAITYVMKAMTFMPPVTGSNIITYTIGP